MQIQYYAISPLVTATNGASLYLSVESGQVVVDVMSGGVDQDYQLWAAIQQFSPPANGLVFINKAMYEQGEPCAIDAPTNYSAVVLESLDSPGLATWNVVYATGQIQLVANPQMDLNVQGGVGTPGTPVILWSYAGGQTNELWTFTAVGEPVEVNVAPSHALA